MADALDSYQRRAYAYFQALAHAGGPAWQRAGWSSSATQRRRWQEFVELLDLRGLSILDVGAGAGGFRGFLRERDCEPSRYVAVELVADNCRLVASEPGVDEVICGTVASVPSRPAADVVTASGLFNFDDAGWAHYFAEQVAEFRDRARIGVLVNAKVPAATWSEAVRLIEAGGMDVEQRCREEFVALVR